MKVYNNKEDQEQEEDQGWHTSGESLWALYFYRDCRSRYPGSEGQDVSWKKGKTRQGWVPFTDSLEIKTLIGQGFVE